MKADLPTPDLRARVLEAARARPSPPRAEVRRSTFVSLLFGFAALAVVFFSLGGADLRTRPPSFLAMTLAGWVAIAAVATWAGAWRGRSMLGRKTELLVGAAVATGPGLFAWMLLGTSMWPGTLGYRTSLAAHFVCFAMVVAMTIGPFLAFAYVRRATDPVHPRATGAALGAVAAAWAGVMVDLHCPVSEAIHVSIGHVLPIVVFAILGALVGRRVFGVRAS